MPDVEVCASLSESKGYCVKTLSLQEREVIDQEWIDFNQRSLKLAPESYAELKALLLKLCKKNKDCNFEETQNKIAIIEQLIDQKMTYEQLSL